MFAHIQQTPDSQIAESAANIGHVTILSMPLQVEDLLPGMLLQVLKSADVFFFKFLSTGRCVIRVRLTLDGLRYELVQRLFETF